MKGRSTLLFAGLCFGLFSCLFLKSPVFAESSTDRINLWPVFYHDNQKTSVFWPLYESYPGGFAFRPLYSSYQDGGEVNFLWPLGGLRRNGYTSWFFPFYFHKNNYYTVLLPFGGKGRSWETVLPPLYIHQHYANFRKTDIIWPLFSYEHDTKSEGMRLFPLFGYENKSNGGTWRYAAWPLAVSNRSADGNGFDWVLPLYLKSKSVRDDYFITPLGGAGKHWQAILPPMYIYRDDSRLKTKTLDLAWPIFEWEQGGDRNSMRIFPFYGYGKSPQNNYWYAAWPLCYSSEHTSWLFPVYFGSRFYRGEATITPVLAFGYDNRAKWFSLLGPLYIHSASVRSNDNYIAWPFIHLGWGKTYSDFTAFPAIFIRNETGPKGSYNHRVIFPLYWDYVRKGNYGDSRWTGLLPLFHYQRQSDKKRDFSVLWPLFYHEENGDDTNWTGVLCRLADYSSKGDQTTFRVLWKLFSYERNGSSLRIDTVPFISYSSDLELTHFSFLWKFFAYEKSISGRKISFLFLPVFDN